MRYYFKPVISLPSRAASPPAAARAVCANNNAVCLLKTPFRAFIVSQNGGNASRGSSGNARAAALGDYSNMRQGAGGLRGALFRQTNGRAQSTVQRTKVCRSELPANDVMCRFNTPRSFLLLSRVSILRHCYIFVTNFITAEFRVRRRGHAPERRPPRVTWGLHAFLAVVCGSVCFELAYGSFYGIVEEGKRVGEPT
ncbi:hypothetical protein EVAR_19044_1 [Eumeta japonica]|uniref:Uncharacterized protein n=1 Tax=Eumeta variegata TaxID=151549 RepID=A0A4C1V763_EUMVA|nr:hypothetical protein EVAR_19044_1 [Eumeta japonica]